MCDQVLMIPKRGFNYVFLLVTDGFNYVLGTWVLLELAHDRSDYTTNASSETLNLKVSYRTDGDLFEVSFTTHLTLVAADCGLSSVRSSVMEGHIAVEIWVLLTQQMSSNWRRRKDTHLQPPYTKNNQDEYISLQVKGKILIHYLLDVQLACGSHSWSWQLCFVRICESFSSLHLIELFSLCLSVSTCEHLCVHVCTRGVQRIHHGLLIRLINEQ